MFKKLLTLIAFSLLIMSNASFSSGGDDCGNRTERTKVEKDQKAAELEEKMKEQLEEMKEQIESLGKDE